MGYMINFIVYTTAMVGIIFLAVFVYKKFSYCAGSKSKFLNIEDCISIGPRKELFVVRAGNERFLVASDVGRTSLISKLEENASFAGTIKKSVENRVENRPIVNNSKNIQNTSSVDELPEIMNFSNKPRQRQPKKVFKNIINNI